MAALHGCWSGEGLLAFLVGSAPLTSVFPAALAETPSLVRYPDFAYHALLLVILDLLGLGMELMGLGGVRYRRGGSWGLLPIGFVTWLLSLLALVAYARTAG